MAKKVVPSPQLLANARVFVTTEVFRWVVNDGQIMPTAERLEAIAMKIATSMQRTLNAAEALRR